MPFAASLPQLGAPLALLLPLGAAAARKRCCCSGLLRGAPIAALLLLLLLLLLLPLAEVHEAAAALASGIEESGRAPSLFGAASCRPPSTASSSGIESSVLVGTAAAGADARGRTGGPARRSESDGVDRKLRILASVVGKPGFLGLEMIGLPFRSTFSIKSNAIHASTLPPRPIRSSTMVMIAPGSSSPISSESRSGSARTLIGRPPTLTRILRQRVIRPRGLPDCTGSTNTSSSVACVVMPSLSRYAMLNVSVLWATARHKASPWSRHCIGHG